jgi:hypothetical protein
MASLTDLAASLFGATMAALTCRVRREARSIDEALGLYPGDVGEVRGGAEIGCLRLPDTR